jgi:hypothetical protein
MKIAVIHASNSDYRKELYEPLKSSVLLKDHHLILPFETDTFPILKPLFENHQVDLILAEVSYPSTGEGIELGWAEVFQIPVICMYKKGYVYSQAIKIVSQTFIEYQDSEDLPQKLHAFLLQFMNARS